MEASDKSIRRIGIKGIGPASWGEHLCAFYSARADLLELVVPFIKAGLEDNEFCMWITGGPINSLEAYQALESVVPNLHHYLSAKHLEIVPYKQWYLSNGTFHPETALKNWSSR